MKGVFLLFAVIGVVCCKAFNEHSTFSDTPQCTLIDDAKRFDCFPEEGVSEELCLNRGCCWKSRVLLKDADIDVPYCYYPQNFPHYKVLPDKTIVQSHGSSYVISKMASTFRQNEILNLTVDLRYDTNQRLRVSIRDTSKDRYEVPLDVDRNREKLLKSAAADYYVSVVDEPFAIKVYRKSTQRLIFDTSVAPLIFADQFIQFSTSLPSDYIYGIGEHRDSFQHKADWTRYSIWNRDIPPLKKLNLYGSHPFYMSVEEDGNAMGFFLLNSNGMDVILQPYPAITFLTIGGILDFFIYMGPTPNDVVHQHTMTIGLPFMPPYYSLGFHLCRWGFNNEQRLVDFIQRNRAAKIPYDVQWTDIDIMGDRKDWTFDEKNFPNLPAIVKDLHDHDQFYINIIDPAISNTVGYEPYDDGLDNNVFIKLAANNETLIGAVWPGQTAFPDFTNPNTTKWWTKMASKYHDRVEFDGIWIDMNEPSNFLDGSLTGCSNSSLDEPPYIPKVLGGQLYKSTICPSSMQYLDNHYNLHNMYGHFEAIATNDALKAIGQNKKRPFILTRSSFAGTGHYAAHWSGDNKATWEDLYYSIPSILNFNMFGIPMIGADICGFALDTTEELCTRWIQLGSFYPFMRNHNDNLSKDQDPAAFNVDIQRIMRDAILTRYQLLPYMYTMFYRSHVFGETVARALFFEFPTDLNTHAIDRQFMYGPALLISPVLTPYTYTVDAYFPNATWYDLYTGAQIQKVASYVNLDAPLSKINVHIRGGHIIALQHAGVNTAQSRKNPFSLLVALNGNASKPAQGSLFWDDGLTPDTIENRNYNLVYFRATSGKLQIELDNAGFKTEMVLDSVVVYGVEIAPTKVFINKSGHVNFNYDDIHKTLTIQYFRIDFYAMKFTSIEWQ